MSARSIAGNLAILVCAVSLPFAPALGQQSLPQSQQPQQPGDCQDGHHHPVQHRHYRVRMAAGKSSPLIFSAALSASAFEANGPARTRMRVPFFVSATLV